jgi:hypothetical protein
MHFKLEDMKKIIIFSGLFFTVPIFAQVEEMIIPSDLKQQTVISEPSTLRKGFLKTSLISNYNLVDKYFDEEGKRNIIMGSNGWTKSWSYRLDVLYGLTDRLQIGIDLPYLNEIHYYSARYVYPSIDSSSSNYNKISAQGLGDIYLAIDYQLLNLNEGKTFLKLQITPIFPTGRKNPENIKSNWEYDKPTGQGYFSLETGLVFRQINYPYSYTGYASYKYNFKGSKIHYPGESEVSFKSGGHLYLGASFNFHLNDWIALMNEIAFGTWGNDKFYATTSAEVGLNDRYTLNYQPSLIFQIRRFRFFEVVSYPLKGKNTGADPAYIFGLQYIF